MTPTEMHIDALMEKIEKLEAENARYREALEKIANDIDCTCRYCVGCNQGSKMQNYADEALKGE